MIDSETLDEIENRCEAACPPPCLDCEDLRISKKLLTELRKLQSDPWKIALVEEINDLKFQRRQLQEREAAFRSALELYAKRFHEPHKDAVTLQPQGYTAREVLQRYPGEKKV